MQTLTSFNPSRPTLCEQGPAPGPGCRNKSVLRAQITPHRTVLAMSRRRPRSRSDDEDAHQRICTDPCPRYWSWRREMQCTIRWLHPRVASTCRRLLPVADEVLAALTGPLPDSTISASKLHADLPGTPRVIRDSIAFD